MWKGWRWGGGGSERPWRGRGGRLEEREKGERVSSSLDEDERRTQMNSRFLPFAFLGVFTLLAGTTGIGLPRCPFEAVPLVASPRGALACWC